MVPVSSSVFHPSGTGGKKVSSKTAALSSSLSTMTSVSARFVTKTGIFPNADG